MADEFWQGLAGFGNALSAIPKGLELGLQPMKTLEDIQRQSIANDYQSQVARNAMLEQQAREGMGVPSYYGDLTQQKQTGFQQDIAKNQLGQFGAQQSLAERQYVNSPEFQGQIQGLDPLGPEYAAALAQARMRTDPFGAGTYATQVELPAQQRAANQQAAEAFIQNSLSEKYGPGVQVYRLQDGTYAAQAPDGSDIDLGPTLTAVAQQIAGNPTAYSALATRQANARAQQVANVGMINTTITAMQRQAGTDPELNGYVNMTKEAGDRLQMIATERAKLDTVYMEPEAKAQRIAQLDAAEQQWSNIANQYMQAFNQRAVQRRGGFGGGGMPGVPGTQMLPGGGVPGAVRQAAARGVNNVPVIRFRNGMVNNAPVTGAPTGGPTATGAAQNQTQLTSNIPSLGTSYYNWMVPGAGI